MVESTANRADGEQLLGSAKERILISNIRHMLSLTAAVKYVTYLISPCDIPSLESVRFFQFLFKIGCNLTGLRMPNNSRLDLLG